MGGLPGMPWALPWPFDRTYMQLALLAGIVVGATAPLIGVFLVQKGLSLMGDGIGHVAVAGMLVDQMRPGAAGAVARHVDDLQRDLVGQMAYLAHRLGIDRSLERLEELAVQVLRALEHQVLEQVREAGLAELLVLAADVIPDVDRHDRRLVVLLHHEREPVREHELRERDVALCGDRLTLGPRAAGLAGRDLEPTATRGTGAGGESAEQERHGRGDGRGTELHG